LEGKNWREGEDYSFKGGGTGKGRVPSKIRRSVSGGKNA